MTETITYIKTQCPNGHQHHIPEYALGIQMETCSDCGARWIE